MAISTLRTTRGRHGLLTLRMDHGATRMQSAISGVNDSLASNPAPLRVKRALWIGVLGLSPQSRTRGHLALNGEPCTDPCTCSITVLPRAQPHLPSKHWLFPWSMLFRCSNSSLCCFCRWGHREHKALPGHSPMWPSWGSSCLSGSKIHWQTQQLKSLRPLGVQPPPQCMAPGVW